MRAGVTTSDKPPNIMKITTWGVLGSADGGPPTIQAMTTAPRRRTEPTRNRPAKVSLTAAGFGVAALLNFATGIGWLNPPAFVAMAVLCGLIAIIAGHMGRRRGRRLDGDGRGMALLGLILGWLLLLICILATAVFFGLLAALAVLIDTVA